MKTTHRTIIVFTKFIILFIKAVQKWAAFLLGEIMSRNSFYDSRAWRKLRREVLKDDHNECQYCKEKHKHVRATIVHHCYHLDQYPQYGLMKYVRDPVTNEYKRNLVSVCRDCHETVCHPERMLKYVERKDPLTEERW